MSEWSFSLDEERYEGQFKSMGDAIFAALKEADEGALFWVGENRPPTQPEEWWEAENWLEHVSCQDEYDSDCADSWDNSTKEQREELEIEVRKILGAWLDRHGLRPGFWIVREPTEFRKTRGAAVMQDKK